jgi:hypothetical protein
MQLTVGFDGDNEHLSFLSHIRFLRNFFCGHLLIVLHKNV